MSKRMTLGEFEKMAQSKDFKAKVIVGHIPAKENKLITCYIGCDPDIEKSGIAIKEAMKPMELFLMKYFDLFDKLESLIELHGVSSINMVIESGWENAKSNFHGYAGQSKSVGERIAKNVGANHEAGKKIVEMCEYLGVDYRLACPAKAKTKPEIFERLTGIKTRNQEKIDAAMLIIK